MGKGKNQNKSSGQDIQLKLSDERKTDTICEAN